MPWTADIPEALVRFIGTAEFLGALGLLVVLLLLTLPYPISVGTLGQLDWGPVIAGYVAVLLQGSAMLAAFKAAMSVVRIYQDRRHAPRDTPEEDALFVG